LFFLIPLSLIRKWLYKKVSMRKQCRICGTYLEDFQSKAPEFMVYYFAYCPECKVVYYTGEDL